MKFLPLILFLSLTASAGQLRLAWNASESSNVTYRVYASTNGLPSTNAVTFDAGTNLTACVSNLTDGLTWYFAATAVSTNGVESQPSNQLVLEIPEPPKNMRVMVLQYSATLTNWQDVGFFKLKIP